jgi:sodium-dependent dicarboxylate transporter 2/3/5
VANVFPIALGIVSAIASLDGGDMAERAARGQSAFATAVMLMVAYGASIGGLLTPIGAPHQLIGRDLAQDATGDKVTFFEWSATFLPIVAVMFVVLCVVLLRINKPEVSSIEGVEGYVAEQRRKLGGLSRGERNALIAFGLAVTFWIAPGIVGVVAGDGSDAYKWTEEHLPEGVVAILAAAVLFVLPLDWKERRFTLTWSEASRIDWGVILLFGSGIVLGGLAGETGLADRVGNALADGLGVDSLFTITLLATIVAIAVSETTSNTASVGIVVPIVIPIASAVGVDPLIPALAATVGAGFGFMLPVSTPPNAIVYGSGMVPITRMIRSGVLFDLAGAVVLSLGLTMMANLVGLACGASPS